MAALHKTQLGQINQTNQVCVDLKKYLEFTINSDVIRISST